MIVDDVKVYGIHVEMLTLEERQRMDAPPHVCFDVAFFNDEGKCYYSQGMTLSGLIKVVATLAEETLGLEIS